MKYHKAPGMDGVDIPCLELTRRNLQVLLMKLDDPNSNRMLIDGDYNIVVRAVENADHYSTRPPGPVHVPPGDEI